MTFDEFLKRIKSYSGGSVRNRITTADRWLKTLAGCTGQLCPADRAKYEGVTWENLIKAAGQRPVYSNDFMAVIGTKDRVNPPTTDGADRMAPVATLSAILTSKRQDRDSDILEPMGAEVDPKCPVLWQHDPTSPIGKLLAVTSQDKSWVGGDLAIANTPLGNDAAYLAEFGALRISHGFRPKEFEPITEKSGGVENFVGFHILKYEMMEISLVSVPSNTDAIIEAVHRSKLSSVLAKGLAMRLDAKRKRVYTTGGGFKAVKSSLTTKVKTAAKTGKPKRVKANDQFEQQLGQVCSGFVHSGDYGLAFYKANDNDPNTFDVWYTMGDADDPKNVSEDGTPYTSEDDIKKALTAIPGVASVQMESETNPPYNEGWRQAYPDQKDWVDNDAQQPNSQPNDTTPAPTGTNGGGGSGGGAATPPTPSPLTSTNPQRKDGGAGGQPVFGSFEHINQVLHDALPQYLQSQGVTINDGETCDIVATYHDNVIVCVGGGDDDDGSTERFYRVMYTMGADGTPAFSGQPEAVELELTVTTATNQQPTGATQPGGTPDNQPLPTGGGTDSGMGQPTSTATKPNRKQRRAIYAKAKAHQWLKHGTQHKGKLGKKDSSMLKEASEHIEEAINHRAGMPTVCKTLCARAKSLIDDIVKSDGKPDPNDPAQDVIPDPVNLTGFTDTQRKWFGEARKAIKKGAGNRLSIAFIFDQLSASLADQDVQEELKKLSS